MAQGTVIVFDELVEAQGWRWPTLITHMEKKVPRKKFTRKHYYYIDAYVSLVNEIEEVTSRSRSMETGVTKEVPLGKRLYFHLYQRLHSYGGFQWDTNNFGTRPNQ